MSFIEKMLGFGFSLPGAASFISPFLEHEEREDQFDASLRHAQAIQAQNIALQREFAQHGVRWRVEDAQAAGLHPLFALGGGGAAFAPNPVAALEDRSSFGAALGRSAATVQERIHRNAILEGAAATADKDHAMAEYYRSLAAKARQEDRQSNAFPDVVTGAYAPSGVTTQAYNRPVIESHPLYSDAVKLGADPMTSRHFKIEGQTAGQDHPSVREFVFPGGFRALMPATEGGGMPEDIDVAMLPFLIGANLNRYGWRWIVDSVNYVTGATPAETRAQDRKALGWLRRALKPHVGSGFD